MKNLTHLLTEVIRTKLYESNDDLTPYELKIDMFRSNRYSASFIAPTKDGFETIRIDIPIILQDKFNCKDIHSMPIRISVSDVGVIPSEYLPEYLPQDISQYDENEITPIILEFIKKIIASNKKIDIIYFSKVPESLANRLMNGIVTAKFNFVKSILFQSDLGGPYLINQETLDCLTKFRQSNLVYSNGDYEVILDRDKTGVGLKLLFKDQIVGTLDVQIKKGKFSFDEVLQNYYVMAGVMLRGDHRGKGLGKLMYKILIDTRSPDIKGLCSLISGRVNTLQIPKIYSNYDTVIEGGYEIIRF